jgi:hypothetical protein
VRCGPELLGGDVRSPSPSPSQTGFRRGRLTRSSPFVFTSLHPRTALFISSAHIFKPHRLFLSLLCAFVRPPDTREASRFRVARITPRSIRSNCGSSRPYIHVLHPHPAAGSGGCSLVEPIHVLETPPTRSWISASSSDAILCTSSPPKSRLALLFPLSHPPLRGVVSTCCLLGPC